MNPTIRSTFVLAAALALACVVGCEKIEEPKTVEEVKSVQWFIEHRDQIMPTLERCKRLPDSSKDGNCANASRAMRAPTGVAN